MGALKNKLFVMALAAVFSATFVVATGYSGILGSQLAQFPGPQLQHGNISDMVNNVTISQSTPYTYVGDNKVFGLGNAYSQNYKNVVSPCSLQAGTNGNYTNGIYNCQPSGLSYSGAITEGKSLVNQVESLNWAGYVGTSSSPVTTSVKGSWVVQAPGSTSSATYSSEWIGIGGYSDDTLVQTGTESDYYDGAAHYTAWYEVLPAAETPISGISVSPGDIINASVTQVPGTSDEWNVTLVDVTQHKGFSIIVTYSSSQKSSDWVEERPELCSGSSCSLTTLASFGTAYYGSDNTGVPGTNFANMGSGTEPISSMPGVTSITMVSENGRTLTTLATPSALSTDGTSFTVSEPKAATTSTTTTTIRPTTTVPIGHHF